jgi:hypothetical protein
LNFSIDEIKGYLDLEGIGQATQPKATIPQDIIDKLIGDISRINFKAGEGKATACCCNILT